MSNTFDTERELAVFIGAIARYFQTVGGEPPSFREPSLELALPPRLDCTGYIPLSGRLDGWIALSLPAALLSTLLERLGETQHDDDTRLDLVAEITGTLAGNAREHFGEHLRISPPLAATADEFPDELPAPPLSFRLPFHCHGSDAYLLVALQR